MIRASLATVAVAVMAGTASADYMFPTAYPSGVNIDTVKQIVSFIWDDNAYSGLNATQYESAPGQGYSTSSWVDGQKPWEIYATKTGLNALNLKSGDFGMAWAIGRLAGGTTEFPPEFSPTGDINNQYSAGNKVIYEGKIWNATGWMGAGSIPVPGTTVGGDSWAAHWELVSTLDEYIASKATKKNPDGSALRFSFNVISGLFVPIFIRPGSPVTSGDDAYLYRVSKYGGWKPNAADKAAFPGFAVYTNDEMTVPVSWGREQPVKASEDATGNVNGELYGRINDVFKMTKTLGHEIGNHTIDHLETNSPLPNNDLGFGRWGGEGFSSSNTETMKWGDTTFTTDEADLFGQASGISWQSMGWKPYAGKMLSTNAWKGLIELGEEDINITLGTKRGLAREDIKAFRAPRLEVSSGLFYALKDLNYLYDCGIEEGYGQNVDGTNFTWPYTLDNGAPNFTYQRKSGEQVSVDSLPAGLWQYPVNAMIVPTDIRDSVWAHYEIISRAEDNTKSDADWAEEKAYWIQNDGRVTGFDFNMFILWGMTKDNVVKTLKYNLDQRLAGGKAPMHVGCHTDYFTPIYDNGTLLAKPNDKTFGLVVTNKWNVWTDRIAAFEDFVDYGISKKVYFWGGDQTIEYAQKIAGSDKLGTTVTPFTGQWNFMSDMVGSTANSNSFTGNISGAAVSLGMATATDEPGAGYEAAVTPGELAELDHISLNYRSNVPLALKLIVEGDGEREVWLNNVNKDVASGYIPLTAFHYNEYFEGTKVPLDYTKITGISIVPIVSGKKAVTAQFSVSDLKFYSGQKSVSVLHANDKKMNVALQGITSNEMKLNTPAAGVYNVSLVSMNGKLIHSTGDVSLKSGVNSLKMNSVAPGVYLVSVKGLNLQKTVKAIVR